MMKQTRSTRYLETQLQQYRLSVQINCVPIYLLNSSETGLIMYSWPGTASDLHKENCFPHPIHCLGKLALPLRSSFPCSYITACPSRAWEIHNFLFVFIQNHLARRLFFFYCFNHLLTPSTGDTLRLTRSTFPTTGAVA